MSTRAARLAKAEARARARLETQRKALAQIQAAQDDEARKTLTRRRTHVGTMVLDTPLSSLDDPTLQGLFQVLAALVETPDPVACLASLLSDVDGTPGRVVPGCASPAERVAPPVPV